ncbi:hypothetical protein FOCC_FOCC012696, partial [Frankliniella occidentalis]
WGDKGKASVNHQREHPYQCKENIITFPSITRQLHLMRFAPSVQVHVADATTAGFWSRRLEEGGSPPAEDASLDTTLPGGPLHPKCLRRGPGTGPGPPYSGSYRKFVNHLVRSNFSDNLNDDSSFVGVEADAPRAPALDCILDDVLAEERDVVVRPLRPPRPPPRLGQHRAGRARGSSALWSGWAPSLTSISASAPLCLCLGPEQLAEQQTPPTPPPTPERPPRLAPRRPPGHPA